MTDDEARANAQAQNVVDSIWAVLQTQNPHKKEQAYGIVSLALADARRECEQVAERWLAAYPPDIFTEPPPGEHGKTVDGCSARAARHVAKGIADDIRALATRRTT